MHPLPHEAPPLRIPREEDHDREFDPAPGGRKLQPVGGMGPGKPGLLAHPLRADHDVRKVEGDVRKGAQELGVEAPRAVVAFPAVAGRHDLVDAVGGEGRDQALDIWRTINKRNLVENILPTRQRARLILRKGDNHRIETVALRRI